MSVWALLVALALCAPNAQGASLRSFDPDYRPGQDTRVTLSISPSTSTLAYALEETPPPGWSIKNANQSGAIVGGKIKWGLYFDNTARVFTYDAAPPAITSDQTFSGVVSLDGVSTQIGGQAVIKFDRTPPDTPK